MDDVLFLVLDESAEGRVNDAFWRACCAGGVEDVKRMGSREWGER